MSTPPFSDDETGDDDETGLFRREMQDVTPLKPDNRVGQRKKPPVFHPPPGTPPGDDDALQDRFSDAPVHTPCPDILQFSRSGIQHSLLKRLRQGRLTIEHRLDLHGLTIAQAREELILFLHECETRNLRHVLIIHGKGFRSKAAPVIKPMIDRWLRVAPPVLAFHSALPADGGSGAVYVLLKKPGAGKR